MIQPADINILVKGLDGQYELSAMMLGIGGMFPVGNTPLKIKLMETQGGQRIQDKRETLSLRN